MSNLIVIYLSRTSILLWLGLLNISISLSFAFDIKRLSLSLSAFWFESRDPSELEIFEHEDVRKEPAEPRMYLF